MMTQQPTRAPAALTWLGRKRTSLLLSCALGAVLSVLGATETARAQVQTDAPMGAFRGTPTTSAGSITRTTGTGTETITVNTAKAIINWSPFDTVGTGTIDFLPRGNMATFQNGLEVSNFAVLNRIIPTVPTRPIALDGTIISQLRAAGTEAFSRGGTVAFFSPGGILIGPNAVFDIGNLLLTTIDPGQTDFDPMRWVLNGAVNPASSVVIQSGARIEASAPGSYIAVVAPKVEQLGTVKANGSIAYVAAEAATLTVNNGLFDIQVETGSSSSPNTLVHDGTTGGPAGANNRIYMVAVPKNAAITALLSGSIGFDAAQEASADNGQIILSAGYNVNNGILSNTESSAGTLADANIRIRSGTLSSDVTGFATGSIVAETSSGNVDFRQDVLFRGGRSVELLARAETALTVGGTLSAASFSDRTGAAGVVSVTARTGGLVSVAGVSQLRADIFNLFGRSGPEVTNGGTVTINAAGGRINFASAVTLGASGSSFTGADVRGGNVLVTSSAGGQANFNSSLFLGTSTIGAAMAAGTGATARGGSSRIVADGGAVTVTGNLSLHASGSGGGSGSSALIGGAGLAGATEIRATNQGTVRAPATNMQAFGHGGTGSAGAGAAGQGGTAVVAADTGGGITLGSVFQSVGALAGNGTVQGGAGTGGSGLASVAGGGSLSLASLNIEASAGGGRGEVSGEGRGGSARLVENGGAITINGDTFLSADGRGAGNISGNSATVTQAGGAGIGGLTEITRDSGSSSGTINVTGVTSLFASGFGGGSSGSLNAAGAAGTGGQARITGGTGSTFTLAGTSLNAEGRGGTGTGDGSRGGTGTGGTALVNANGGAINPSSLSLVTDGLAETQSRAASARAARPQFAPRPGRSSSPERFAPKATAVAAPALPAPEAKASAAPLR